MEFYTHLSTLFGLGAGTLHPRGPTWARAVMVSPDMMAGSTQPTVQPEAMPQCFRRVILA